MINSHPKFPSNTIFSLDNLSNRYDKQYPKSLFRKCFIFVYYHKYIGVLSFQNYQRCTIQQRDTLIEIYVLTFPKGRRIYGIGFTYHQKLPTGSQGLMSLWHLRMKKNVLKSGHILVSSTCPFQLVNPMLDYTQNHGIIAL